MNKILLYSETDDCPILGSGFRLDEKPRFLRIFLKHYTTLEYEKH